MQRNGRRLHLTDSSQAVYQRGVAILPQPICQRLDKQSLLWLPLESELKWSLGLIWREGNYLSRNAQA